MSETPRPDLDQVREALRRHDERPHEEHEQRRAPDQDVPEEEPERGDEPPSE